MPMMTWKVAQRVYPTRNIHIRCHVGYPNKPNQRRKEKKLRSLEETDVNEVFVRSSSNKPNHVWEWSLVGQLQHVIVSPMPISLYVTYTMLTLRPIANPG